MNIGEHEDLMALSHLFGDEHLRQNLQHAEIGQFNERLGACWRYRLSLAELGALPPAPVRVLE